MIDTGNTSIKLNFSSDEADDIRKCLSILYSTAEGEQPLDREFGISREYLNYPLPTAKSMFSLEVVKKTAIYEPRVTVDSVTFEQDSLNGKLIPTVHLAKGDEEEVE